MKERGRVALGTGPMRKRAGPWLGRTLCMLGPVVQSPGAHLSVSRVPVHVQRGADLLLFAPLPPVIPRSEVVVRAPLAPSRRAAQ
jgi:hypothetical protein